MRSKTNINGPQAALTMVGAMAVIGVIDNYITLISESLSIWQFMLMRSAIALPLLAVFSILGFVTMRPKRLWAVVLRNACVALSMLFYFGSLSYMPIAQSLAGLFTSPLFILIISSVVLGERVGPVRILCVLLGFFGISLVLQLNFATLKWLSVVPIIGGFFYAIGALMTRYLCDGESTVSMLSMLMSIQALLGLIALIALAFFEISVPDGSNGFLLRSWVWPTSETLGYIVLQAVGSIFGIGLIIRAYQIGEASYVAIYEYSVFIFAPLFAWIMFGQSLDATQLLGLAVITLSGALITLRSARGERSATEETL